MVVHESGRGIVVLLPDGTIADRIVPEGLKISAMALSPDGSWLAAGLCDGRVLLWTYTPGESYQFQGEIPDHEGIPRRIWTRS
jgi:WD40 repeat protein